MTLEALLKRYSPFVGLEIPPHLSRVGLCVLPLFVGRPPYGATPPLPVASGSRWRFPFWCFFLSFPQTKRRGHSPVFFNLISLSSRDQMCPPSSSSPESARPFHEAETTLTREPDARSSSGSFPLCYTAHAPAQPLFQRNNVRIARLHCAFHLPSPPL